MTRLHLSWTGQLREGLCLKVCDFGLAEKLIQNQADGSAQLAEKEESGELFRSAQTPQTFCWPVPAKVVDPFFCF
jgi:hypothetical protein